MGFIQDVQFDSNFLNTSYLQNKKKNNYITQSSDCCWFDEAYLNDWDQLKSRISREFWNQTSHILSLTFGSNIQKQYYTYRTKEIDIYSVIKSFECCWCDEVAYLKTSDQLKFRISRKKWKSIIRYIEYMIFLDQLD